MGVGWDTIIVGAGVGGLTAAARLVKAGLHVLVLERNSHPGGTAYVYKRKGFAFPMGPLGFSHPGLVRSILRDLGIENGLLFHRVHYRIKAFGCDLPLSLPSAALVKEFADHFLSDARAVGRFFRIWKTFSPFHSALIPTPIFIRALPLNISLNGSRTGGCAEFWNHRNHESLQRPAAACRHVEPYDERRHLVSRRSMGPFSQRLVPGNDRGSKDNRTPDGRRGEKRGLGEIRLGSGRGQDQGEQRQGAGRCSQRWF